MNIIEGMNIIRYSIVDSIPPHVTNYLMGVVDSFDELLLLVDIEYRLIPGSSKEFIVPMYLYIPPEETAEEVSLSVPLDITESGYGDYIYVLKNTDEAPVQLQRYAEKFVRYWLSTIERGR